MSINPDSVSEPYQKYFKLATGQDVLQELRTSGFRTQELIHGIAESKAGFRYEPDKWTIGEVFEHLLDTERIFVYHALLFARGETVISYSFDQNMFAKNVNSSGRSLSKMADELMRSRSSALDLFGSFSPAALQRQGTLNEHEITAEIMGFCIGGHEAHHRRILEERYLK